MKPKNPFKGLGLVVYFTVGLGGVVLALIGADAVDSVRAWTRKLRSADSRQGAVVDGQQADLGNGSAQ